MNQITVKIENLIFGFPKYNINPELVDTHKKGGFYLTVLESVKKGGMKNSLLVIESGDMYEVVIGNNRLIAAKDLGIKELQCVVMPNREKETIKKFKSNYQVINI